MTDVHRETNQDDLDRPTTNCLEAMQGFRPRREVNGIDATTSLRQRTTFRIEAGWTCSRNHRSQNRGVISHESEK